jgi:hypothetical protein
MVARTAVAKPDISNMAACVEDARQAGLDQDPGPPEPTSFGSLVGRLHAARSKMPPLYLDAVFTPFLAKLTSLGESGYNEILRRDPRREGEAALMFDIAQAILQFAEGFETTAVGAFLEVVSDLYDGFLSAEDRTGVEPPDLEVLPPLVKFGNPNFGPYTWPADATRNFGVKVAIVSLPPSNTRRGLMAWAALGHETAGHDILHADAGLLRETSNAVRAALLADNGTASLAGYWADRIDETASDVLGVLNIGPAAGIGLISFFRGLNAAFTGRAKLRSAGPESDPHPADILRGFLAAAVVRQLKFAGAADWAKVIDDETKKDAGTIVLAGRTVTAAVAQRSAQLVAEAIVNHPMVALENHSFGEIQNWRDADEDFVQQLHTCLTTAIPLTPDLEAGVFAAHLVAAATTAALEKDANIPLLQQRMLELLKRMNDHNPSFGPLAVRHPGDLVRDRAYIPTWEAEEEPEGRRVA